MVALAGGAAAALAARLPKARYCTPAMRKVPPMMLPMETGTRFLKKNLKKPVREDFCSAPKGPTNMLATCCGKGGVG